MGSEVAKKPDRRKVQQFSLFADNKVGKLNDIMRTLKGQGIHTLGLCTLDTTDNAIIRLIVSDGLALEDALFKDGVAYAKCDVVAVGFMPSEDLTKITESLYAAEINIHYVYPLFIHPDDKGILILQTDDNELASSVLERVGLTVLDEGDLLR